MRFVVFAFFLSMTLAAPSLSRAELSPERKACAEALDEAYEKVQNMRDNQANQMNTSSTGQQPQQSQPQTSPITDMMNKIAEGNQKKAELVKQKMEQERQINTEQFKQITEIEDKEREIAKEKSKLPIEIKKAEFDRKRQEAEVRMKCQARAEQEYNTLIAGNAEKAAQSRFTVNSLSQVRGTRSRMRSLRKIYYSRCMADPATQEALQLAIDEMDTKLYNFNIQAGIHNADLEYTKSKIPKLIGHMDEQRRYVAEATDIQMNAIDQAQQQAQTGMMFALLTSAVGSSTRMQSAGNFNSADQIINNFDDSIRTLCMNPVAEAYEVPSDMAGYFSKVNRECRPSSVDDPNKSCVRSNGQPSYKPRQNSYIQ